MKDRTKVEGWGRFSAEEILGVSIKAYGCCQVVEKEHTGEGVHQQAPEPSADVAVTAHAFLPAESSGCWKGVSISW